MPRVFIIAEIGINHNGDLNIAKKLIDGAVFAGCDAVKFQKRTIETVYSRDFLDSPRESPWGTTQRDQKEGLEFNELDYHDIDFYCRSRGIAWFASAWDLFSLDVLGQFNLLYNKIASAMLTNLEFLEAAAKQQKHTFISTGMSTIQDIDMAVEIFRKHQCPFEVMHCVSSYNMPDKDANLKMIPILRGRYGKDVGYSGHEQGLIITCAAVALGASSVERHITLDHAMYGSDQGASVEIDGMCRLVKYIRAIEEGLGDGVKTITDQEKINAEKLREVQYATR